MKRFLTKLLIFAIPLVIIIPIWILLVRFSEWNNFGLLKFQIDKLIHNKGMHFNVVYIGDSSGGYALSTFQDPSSINLCLTGSFCYNGLVSYLDIIDQYITYDTIAVINTLDIASRPISVGAYWLPYLHSDDFMTKAIAYFYSAQFARGVIINRLVPSYHPVPKSEFTDYPITQGRTKSTSNEFHHQIDLSQLNELKKLNDKLESSGRKFYLLFGPSLPYSEKYYRELCDLICAYNIRHELNVPFLLNGLNKGNSPDHVHPSYRDLTTSYYKKLIRNH